MPEKRNIFADDKKLMHLCEDFLHHVSELEKQALVDPEQTPTPTKLISLLKYEGDPEPLTMEEYMELQEFIGDPKRTGHSDYADWKTATLFASASSFIDEEGRPKNTFFDAYIEGQ